MGSQLDDTPQGETAKTGSPDEPARDDEFMSVADLGHVIDDLRTGRRPALLADQEP